MALSYYSNWDSFQQMDSDIDSKLLPEAWNYDCLFDPTDFFLDKPNSLLHDFPFEAPYNDLSSINAAEVQPLLLQQEPQPLPYPKRHKPCEFDQIYSDYSHFNPTFFSGVSGGASYKSQVPTPSLVSTLQDYSLAEIAGLPPLPDFLSLPGYAGGSFDSGKKEQTGGSLSAQSVAARHRRRRITEKTQELGKLVPGGQKMNTAEMFQAAYKYIKFLQAQVGLLELIASNNQENAQESSSEEFQVLVESPLIQEKLYSTENCLVPQKFLEQVLGSDKEV